MKKIITVLFGILALSIPAEACIDCTGVGTNATFTGVVTASGAFVGPTISTINIRLGALEAQSATSYIKNQTTLQSGATFFVSSGTVGSITLYDKIIQAPTGQFTIIHVSTITGNSPLFIMDVGSIKFNDGTILYSSGTVAFTNLQTAYNNFTSTTQSQILNALNSNATEQVILTALQTDTATLAGQFGSIATDTTTLQDQLNIIKRTTQLYDLTIGTTLVNGAQVSSDTAEAFITAIQMLGGSSSGSGSIYVQNGNYVWPKAVGVPRDITFTCASSASIILNVAASQLISSGVFVGCSWELYGTGVDKWLLGDDAMFIGGSINKVTVETGATTGKISLKHTKDITISGLSIHNISYTAANAAFILHKGATNFSFLGNTVDAAIANSGTGNNFMEYIGGTRMNIKGNTMNFKNRAMFADIRNGGELGGPSSQMLWEDNIMNWTTFADGSGLFFFLTNTLDLDVSTPTTFLRNTINFNTTGTERLWGLALTSGKVSGLDIRENTISNTNGAATVTVLVQDTEAQGTMSDNIVTGFDTFISGTGSILYTGRGNTMDGTPQ